MSSFVSMPRRVIFYCLFCLLLGSLAWGICAEVDDPHLFVRESVHTVAPEVLDAYAKAIDEMERLGADNPISWYYQANIHHVPSCTWNGVALPGCVQDTSDPSTWPGDTGKIWAACPHGNLMFLSWHRLYLYYLERLVRHSADAPEFTLPYWNYSQPEVDPRRLPERFRNPQSASNALFVGERNEVDCPASLLVPVNAGAPLDYDQITSDENALQQREWRDFSFAIEQQPHNRVHGYLGALFDCSACGNGCACDAPPCKTGWMATIITAARDGIFWLHHANIDRAWVQWAAIPGHQNPSTPEEINRVLDTEKNCLPTPRRSCYLKSRCALNGISDWEECTNAEIFVFFDAKPDGTVEEVRWSARGMLEGTISTEQLGYRYDDEPKDPTSNYLSLAGQAVQLVALGAAGSPEEKNLNRLGNSARVFDLPLAEESSKELERSLRSMMAQDAEPSEVRLQIKGIHLAEGARSPIGHYEVYVNLPAAREVDLSSQDLRKTFEDHYIGSLGFFALSGEGHHHGFDFEANITENVLLLKLRRAWKAGELSVTFVPRGPHPEEEAIEFDAMELIYE